jgi:hypothetical protein
LKLTLRFYPGQDDDLIAWLNDMRASYGKKGEAVKDTLRCGLAAQGEHPATALDTSGLLADIRLIMESVLASHVVQSAPQAQAQGQETQLAEERLALLDQDLTLNPTQSAWNEMTKQRNSGAGNLPSPRWD